MPIGNIRCKRNCGSLLKRKIVTQHDEWKHTEQGWVCPYCNPTSNLSWGLT